MKYSKISFETEKNVFRPVDLFPADLMSVVCGFVEPRDLSGIEDAFLVELDAITSEAEFAAVMASLEYLPNSVETVQQIAPTKTAEAYAAKGLGDSQVRGGLGYFPYTSHHYPFHHRLSPYLDTMHQGVMEQPHRH